LHVRACYPVVANSLRTVRSSVVRAFTAALAAALAIVLAVPAPSTAAPNDGLRFEVETTYELQPDERRVRVSMDISLTSLMPDQGSRYFYFDQIGIPVLAEATNAAAERVGGGALSATVGDTDDPMWSMLNVRLSPVLMYGRPQRIEVRYDLPDLPPRSEGWTRASEAYASFLVHAVGDPGVTDVTVIVPADYTDLHAGGAELGRRLIDGRWQYTAADIADPEEWWVVFAARNDDLLDTRSVSTDGRSIVLRSWPGDEQWADYAEDTVTTGIPALEGLIGQPWPVSRELTITESSSPHAHGYGGWYDPSTDMIEVSDELDPAVMLHELSHAWFNERLTSERWFLEGLAELYAHEALAELDGSAPAPERPPSSHPGEQPLVQWEQVPFESSDADEYVYATAWWLLYEIYTEVGAETMAAILAAAADREISYRAGEQAEDVSGRVGWQRLLDLTQEVGGSEAVVDLYRGYVLGPDELPLLDDREAARSSYTDFLESAGGWPAPLQLREAMTRWHFDEVDGLIELAGDVLAQRDAVVAVTAAFGVDELPALAESFRAAGLIDDVAADAAAYVEAAETIAAAQRRDVGVGGLLSDVALLGADVDGRLAAAAGELADGDPAAAGASAARVLSDVEQAPVIGTVLLAQLLVAAGAFWPLRRWRQRRVDRSSTTVGSDPWPTDEPYSSPSTR
jgi:hypothetical protein